MKRQWTHEELIEHWTLSSKELDLISDSTTDHNLLGAACLLKYFQYEGRFPANKTEPSGSFVGDAPSAETTVTASAGVQMPPC